MIQILKSGNDFYIKEFDNFYGSFHSIADAERYLKSGRDYSHKLDTLSDYKVIISCV